LTKKSKSLLSRLRPPNALIDIFKFVIIKGKKGEIVRDRGSNMSNTIILKLEEVLSFTWQTLLRGIYIDCYIECCILVYIISFVHHASSYMSEKKISKVRKFLQKAKLSILIDYNLIVIDYTICLKLVELCLVSA